MCQDAILKGHQTLFCSLFDLTAKMTKSKNVYNLIEYYGRVPILCLDELGYVMPAREQADAIFQIVSKLAELATTIITTNLVPSHWGKIFETATASAILDRLSMNGRFITLLFASSSMARTPKKIFTTRIRTPEDLRRKKPVGSTSEAQRCALGCMNSPGEEGMNVGDGGLHDGANP